MSQLWIVRRSEESMKVFIYISLVLLFLVLIIDYSLLVIAHDADEKAEEMYKKWQEERRKNDDTRTDISDSCCGDGRQRELDRATDFTGNQCRTSVAASRF